jgi:hypothetical protein
MLTRSRPSPEVLMFVPARMFIGWPPCAVNSEFNCQPFMRSGTALENTGTS